MEHGEIMASHKLATMTTSDL